MMDSIEVRLRRIEGSRKGFSTSSDMPSDSENQRGKQVRKPDSVINRLNRIAGQVEGIKEMYNERRSCMEIAQQIVAVRSALASVGKEIVSGEAVRCMGSRTKQKEFVRMIQNLFSIS
jgi:DNA-binding FrmR family transcriptional regulator